MVYKLYIGCLPGDASESELLALFSNYGCIEKIILTKKKTTLDLNCSDLNPSKYGHNQTETEPDTNEKCLGFGHLTCSNYETHELILKSSIYYRQRKLEISNYLDNNDLQKLHLDINLRKVLVKYLSDGVSD
jgi:RNA recognition motif. (a.k.a. RRM, RBD, or RNP domain)